MKIHISLYNQSMKICGKALTLDYSVVVCRDLSWPSQSKIEQKLPKMVYIIPNFFVLQIGENLTKNPNIAVTDARKFA